MKTWLSCLFLGWCAFSAPALAAVEEAPLPASAAQHALFQLSYEDVEGAVGFALADKGAGQKVAATVSGDRRKPLFSYDKPISVEIRGLQFDSSNKRWNASLLFVSGEAVISAIPVAGRYEETVEIPVLKRQVKSGEIIRAEDIELRDHPFVRTRSDTITDLSSLVGKSPTRSISPGRPVYESELASPALVKKNSVVQIRYLSAGLEISATGQSVDEGAKGDVITVRNLDSKKLLRAVIADEKTVDVISAGTALSSNNSNHGARSL